MKSESHSRLQKAITFISTLIAVASAALTAPFASAVTETFNTAATTNWLCPGGVTSIQVECWGGGGAGGSGRKDTAAGSNTSQNGGGGGGGGAYARRVSVPVTPGLTYAITIPAQAVSGSAGTTTQGGGRVSGGTVTFTGDSVLGIPVVVSAAGGQGGACAYTTVNGTTGQPGGTGGTTVTGDAGATFSGGAGSAGNTGATNVSGSGGGGAGDANPGGAAVTTASTTAAGAGGVAGGGAGGAGRAGGNTNAGVGAPGATPGGGGGGGHNQGINTRLGGDGGLGQIKLTYTIPPNFKANNTDNLNLASSWTAFLPTGGIAEWNNIVAAANTTSLGSDLTFSGIKISDPGGLVTINSGNTLTLGAAAIDLDLSAATQDLTMNCDLAMGAANVWNVASGRTLTLGVGGSVSGSAAITKQGDGTATLAGAVTHTGSTTVSGGTLTVASSGSITTASNILLTVSGASAVANIDGSYTSSGGGGMAINSGGILNTSGTVSISGANNQALFLGTAGGSGTWNVTGGSVSVNYTGNGWGISNGGNGTLNVSAGSVTTAATNTFQVGFLAGGTGTLNISGTGLVTISSGSGSFNIGRVASATGVINLDGGTFAMGRNISKFSTATGTFNFNGGLLQAGLSSATYMTGLTTANVRDGGAKIDTNGFNVTINQALVHSIIGGDNATDGGLTKSGLGTLTLTGANTYTGGTLVNVGTLKFSTAVAAATNVTVAGSAEAGVLVGANDAQWVNTGDLTLQNSGAVVIDYGSTAPSTTVAPMSVTNFTIGTTPGVRLTANPVSLLLVGQAYPVVTWTGSGPADGSAFASLTHRLAGTFSVSSNTLFFTVTANTAGTPISWNTGNGTWDTSTVNWLDSALAPTTYFDTLDAVLFGDASGASGNPVVTLGAAVSPLSVTMNSTAHDYTVSGAGSIGGSGALTLDAANTRTFTLSTANNAFTGGTTVNGGTLVLGDATNTLRDTGVVTVDGASAILSLGANSDTVGAVSLKNGASISGSGGTLTGSSYVLESGSISAILGGASALSKTTAGTVTLSGANSFTGATTITGGTLRLANTGALASTTNITLNTANTTIELGTDSAFTTLPGITGGSNLTHTMVSDRDTAGAALNHQLGTINFGASTFNFIQGTNVNSGTAGVTFVSATMTSGSAGTSVINPTTATLTITGGVTSSGSNVARTLQLDGTGTGHSIGGVITQSVASALSLTKSNTSTWTLSGANTYTGATTVNSGTLVLSGNANIAAAGAYTVGSTGNNATLEISAGTYALAAQNYFVGSGATAGFTGTVNHSGGTISFTSGNGVLIGNGGANGVYNLSGTATVTTGLFSSTTRGVILGVNTGSSGTLNMSGGTLTLTNSSLQVGRSDSAADNTTTLYNQTGGSATVGTLRIGGNGAIGIGETATFSVTGGNFAATTFDRLVLGDTNTAAITIGGTAQVTLPAFPLARGTGSSASITFDSGAGGYLRPAATSATYMQAATFASANLTANGAKFDTNGFDITIGQVLQNAPSVAGTLTKSGAGILTLTGANTYTGNTTVETGGTLVLADNAQLKFVTGATSGTNNQITGAGTVTIDGDFDIDTTLTDASALTTGSWTLVNAATLAETFNGSFTILGAGWSENANVWTKTVGSKKYTFTESDGILVLSPAASYASWIDSFFPGETDPLIIGAAADPDNDGIPNGVEMVIGGNPATGMDAALLPTIDLVNADPDGDLTFNDYLLFTYRRSDLSVTAGLTADCETDTDLVAPWTPATGAPGVVIQVDDNFTFTPPAAADTDRVRVYVPRGANTELFGRLNVVVP